MIDFAEGLDFAGTASVRDVGLIALASDDFDAFPERHVAANVFRCLLGGSIIPSSTRIGLASSLDVVVVGRSLPAANAGVFRWLKARLVKRRGWEVVVAFNDFSYLGFGDDNTVPDCFWHGISWWLGTRGR